MIFIEEMTLDDLAEIMAIERASFPTPWSENMFRKELRIAFSRNFVARAGRAGGREIVGYINYWIYASEVHLNSIAVRSDERRQGIASKLMAEMVRKSWQDGARLGTLEVRKSNRAAIGLYEGYGFIVKGVRPGYYEDSKEDGLIMWCDLEESMKRIAAHGG